MFRFVKYLPCLLLAAGCPQAAGETLAQALDGAGLQWTTGGDAVWKPAAVADAHSGGSVAELKFLSKPQDPGFNLPVTPVSSSLETTVQGPGVFSVWVRHNHNPGQSLDLRVNGILRVAADTRRIFAAGYFSPWRRLTIALPAGAHHVALLHTLTPPTSSLHAVSDPAVQLDDAALVPPLDAGYLEALGVLEDEIWLAGGEGIFSVAAGAGRLGGNAVRVDLPPSGPGNSYSYPVAPWLMQQVQGPATVSRWMRRVMPGQPGAVPQEPWHQIHRIIPPGVEWFYWENLVSELFEDPTVVPVTTIPLAEALESGEAIFTQSSAEAWQGIKSAAAPDGVDAAWTVLPTGATSWMEHQAEGPLAVSFRFSKSSSLYDSSGLSFSVAGRTVPMRADRLAVILPPGPATLRWSARHGSTGSQPVGVLLDQLNFAPAAAVSLGEALDAPDLTWITGQPGWSGIASASAPDGTDAAVPPIPNGGGAAWLETTVTGPGRMRFHWPLGGFAGGPVTPGILTLLVDGKELLMQQQAHPRPLVEVGPGPHTFRWEAAQLAPAEWVGAALDEVVWQPDPQGAFTAALGGGNPLFAAHDPDLISLAQGLGRNGGDAVRLRLKRDVDYNSPDRNVSMGFPGGGTVSFWTRGQSDPSIALIEPRYTADNYSGEWRYFTQWLDVGSHRLTWAIKGQYSFSVGNAEVFLADVKFTPAQTIPLAWALNGGTASDRIWTTSPQKPWQGMGPNERYGTGGYAPASSPGDPSWLETTVTGPAVLTYRHSGNVVRLLLDGFEHPFPSNFYLAALYIPPGEHVVRWQNEGTDAMLGSVVLRPMSGQISLTVDAGGLLLTVPRPSGIPDSHIGVESLKAGVWTRETTLTVIQSDPSVIQYRPSWPAGVSGRVYRAFFRPL